MTSADPPLIYWLFGPPEAGRPELAEALLAHCQAAGRRITLLDGNMLREGLCKDLGFTEADQLEKVRRGAYLAKSHAAGGSMVICSFLTAKESHRELVRQILGDQVCLIYIQCALKGCKICPGKKQKHADAAETEKQIAFEIPTEADAVISTHNRAATASLLALCKLIASAPATPAQKAEGGRARASIADMLSAREREVLSLLSKGLRHKEVAERLGISATTVRTHIERACVKLSASSRTEAVARFVALSRQFPGNSSIE